jgi:hypothetical protein
MRPTRTQAVAAPRYRHPVQVDQISDDEVAQLVRSMIALSGGTARIIEFCYWTSEPGMLELVRTLAVLPDDARDQLRAFFDAAPPAAKLSVAEEDGQLTLSFQSADEGKLRCASSRGSVARRAG